MSDILGPANAINAVTSRPAETRSFLSLDSWFKDCSNPTADDGTDVTASWLNGMLAALRSVWRSNGMRLDGITPVVPEVGTDDGGVLKAIQQLIQRGQLLYAVDSSVAANAVIASFTPPITEYKEGLRVLVKVANTFTGGATTANFNLLGNKSVKRLDGQNPSANDVIAGGMVELAYDGTVFQIMNVWSQRSILTANRDYYVNNATGNDTTMDGLSALTPFKTIQKAVDVMSTFDNNGFDVNIHVADGTYAPVNLKRITGSGSCYIIGNQANAANCIVTGASNCFNAVNVAGSYDITGFKCSSSGGDGIAASGGGTNIAISCMEFGQCGGPAHIVSQYSAVVTVKGTVDGVASPYIKLSGGSTYHMMAIQNGAIDYRNQVLTILVPVTFVTAFAHARLCGSISSGTGVILTTIINPGNVTGSKYQCMLNGVIDTNSGALANYFPGSLAGTTATDGVYN